MEGDVTYNIKSTGSTHYTTAIAAGAAEEEEFPGLRGDGQGYIYGVGVRSKDNRDWAVEVWDADDNILAVVDLLSENAVESGSYYFTRADALEIPIPLTVPKETVTIALRNNGDTAKTAYNATTGAGEAIVLLTIKK